MGDKVDTFRRFFEAVHGVEPFAWQLALAERVLEGPGWPDAIDVPTGFGKTAAIDVAIVALADQAGLPPDRRTAPTRVFVVVDRRLLVDQAFERARRIQAALDDPRDDVVATVAQALRTIGGGPRPLEVVRMRGGVSWSWRWLPSPAQPAVVAATVDQFGSRLLFRGYGVGDRLRPIDAALCGCDALVILDEAHLSVALASTVASAHRLESEAEQPLPPAQRNRTVLLSATLRDTKPSGTTTVRLEPEAEVSIAARRRLAAVRRLRLVELETSTSQASSDLAETLAGLGERAVDREGERFDRIGIVVNTVPVARRVFRLLSERVGDRADVYLLTGRCRGFEREHLGLAETIRKIFGAVGPRPTRDRPAVLVATQTIEVGADFDLDFLVSEAAPLDALLQRLGRLDRLGYRGDSEAVCIFVPSLHREHPVYADAIQRTWEWIQTKVEAAPLRLSLRRASAEGAPALELGVTALRGLLDGEALAACSVPPPPVPIVVRPHLDAWARTAPSPAPDQPVEPFLHGLDRGAPEVSIAWRAPLPSIEAWRVELEHLPLREEERVEVPMWVARRFLRGLAADGLADLEAGPEPSTTPLEARDTAGPVRAIVQRTDGSIDWLVDPLALRPGDTVVLEPSAGGHDRWGWTGEPGLVPDVADLVPRSRPSIRLRPSVLVWAAGMGPDEARSRLAAADTPLADLAADVLLEAAARIRGREESDAVQRRWAEHAERMRELILSGGARVIRVSGGRDAGDRWAEDLGLLVVGRSGDLSDERDDAREGSSSSGSVPVAFVRHGTEVGQLARLFAERVGITPDLVAAVELAGRLHDLGKLDRRFQVMLYQGDPDRFEASGTVLAKSGMDPGDRAAFRRARRLAGLPQGFRHEALSAAVVARVLPASDDVDADLVTHLVAAHHGYSRPLFEPVEVAGPAQLVVPEDLQALARFDLELVSGSFAYEQVDWLAPLRFSRLCRRYGFWGLALLESIVRLADMAASEATK